MKKGVKIALITAAGCMAVGGCLMGAGRAAGGYSQLHSINGWRFSGYMDGMMPWNYSIYSLPGLGNLIDAIEQNSDYWENRADSYADRWEDWADRLAGRWEDRADRWAENVEAKAEKLEHKIEAGVDSMDYVFDSGWEDSWEDGIFYDEDSFKGGNTSRYNGSEAEPGQEVYNGDFETDIAFTGDLKKLDVEIGIHGLEIVEGTENKVHIQGKNCDRIQCYVKNGKLYVRDVGKNKKYVRNQTRTIVLAVPKNMNWEEADLDADMSYVRTKNLTAQKAALDADMGSIEIRNLTADQVSVQADMGGIAVKNMQTGYLEADADMGSVELAGIVNGDIDASADMGSIVLKLYQKKGDFNYELSTSMGGITLGGSDYSGLDKVRTIENGADKKMVLDSSMGSIDISFK